ncbi:MAG: hypothetical protein K6F77_02755 [Lachnospiraceae bacterium]|nr:hypothetical protein [Lachnospiraceae bacterium]
MGNSLLFDGEYEGVNFKNFRYLKDLNVSDVVVRISRGKSQFKLDELYSERLMDLNQIYYRQAIFKDMDYDDIYNGISQFSTDIVNLNKAEDSTTRVYNYHQRNYYKMNEVALYIDLVERIQKVLQDERIISKGLQTQAALFTEYVNSSQFIQMKSELKRVQAALDSIHYSVRITSHGMEVFDKTVDVDYSDVLEETFRRFKQYDTDSYLYHGFQISIKLNGAEERVLEEVVKFHRDVFASLGDFADKYKEYKVQFVLNFYSEIQFYLSYIDFMRPLKKKGMIFSFPVFNDDGDYTVEIKNGFNVAVARNNETVITNDFVRDAHEDVYVITGANQGGKTTFARMVGQIIHFAQIGAPVAAEYARLFLCTEILAHFEVDEDVATENGKLKEDLVRVKELLECADERSIFIFNEVFSSTTMEDANVLGVNVIRKIRNIGSICIYVTFLDKIIKNVPGAVSMVSQTLPDGVRTFKIIRKEADGLSYAMMLAEKYNLTYDQILNRLNRNAEGGGR